MQVYERTANQEHHFGRLYDMAKLGAAGFSWPVENINDWHPGMYKNVQPRFNGGVCCPYESRLQAGDKLYRFAPSGCSLENHLRGRWWFDEETCVFLWSKSGYENRDANFRNQARRAFGVLDEWGDMGNLVTVVLKEDFWCIKGSTAPAKESSGPVVMHNPFGTDVLQIFVPGGFTEATVTAKRAAFDRLVY